MARTSKEFFDWYHTERWNLEGSYEERQAAEAKMFEDWYREMEVGDHAHVNHWSDVSPVTIIKKTAQSMTVRFDKAELDPSWKPEWVAGGFSAVCLNNDDQKWIIEEDPNGKTETFRWHKRSNHFENGCGETLVPGWVKHYDYNF